MERRRADSSSGRTLEEPGAPAPGLVELMVIAIPELSDAARIAEALKYLVESSTIRILDVVVVTTGNGGTFDCLEYEEVAGLALLREVEGEVGGWLSGDDIALVSDALPPRTTGVVLIIEDTWAAPLDQVVKSCGGRIAGGERIPTGRGASRGGHRHETRR